MRHFPASRWHPEISGISASRPVRPAFSPALAAAAAFAAGFFLGAILFGQLLLTLHR